MHTPSALISIDPDTIKIDGLGVSQIRTLAAFYTERTGPTYSS